MCGLVGIYSQKKTVSLEKITEMVQILKHRGPNDQGVWGDEHIGLGHTRLSIHDLSIAGHQPMTSFSGRWVIAFNGEIYNYQAIKSEMLSQERIMFNGGSDTEVLVNAIDLWGLEKTLKKCVGMFAFAVWDKQEKQLYLARDRFGEKPLYYGQIHNDFVFASELSAIHFHYRNQLEINRDVLATYMRYSYIPAPYSIYQHIFKLVPGSYLKIDSFNKTKLKKYWDASKVIQNIKSFEGNYQEATDQLDQQLKNTLSLQMAADVPLGAFLSGGIDSSAIVAMMQSLTDQKVQTFSIGFYDKRYDEANYARAVAKHIGTEHTDVYVSEKDALSIIPELSKTYSEPFADSSQIPTYLVSQLARSKVAVSLSGDGGDEIFGGYHRYLLADKIRRKILKHRLLKAGIANIPLSVMNLVGKFFSQYRLLEDKTAKLKYILKYSNQSEYDLYKQICSLIYQPQKLVLNSIEKDIYQSLQLNGTKLSYTEWMMYADSQTYMMEDILTKVDRAAMSNSLETRVPFLDHRIYEFAWSLPLDYKLTQGCSKRILRDVLYRYVPKNLVDRPSMGFAVPFAEWLRGPLKPWAESLINPDLLARQGYLNTQMVQRYWQQHQSGKRNWHFALWNILMFQAWLEEYK